jgi:hypothetical protein
MFGVTVYLYLVTLEILIALLLNTESPWNVTPCRLVKISQRYEDSNCHHLQIQANYFPWTPVTTYQSTRRDIPEDLVLYLLASSRGFAEEPYSHSDECTPHPLTLCLHFFLSCEKKCVCLCVCVCVCVCV